MGQSQPLCVPFRIHQKASLPKPPAITAAQSLAADWENATLTAISGVRGHRNFPARYESWKKKNPKTLSEVERFSWLHCVLFYIQQDMDHDGVPDWTALVDSQPSRVLYPQDEDMDGDGVENVMDPDPLDLQKKGLPLRGKIIPAHLRADDQAVYALQKKLFREYGILTLDHTDRHSAQVLSTLYFLLSSGFSKEFIKSLESFKYIYAFRRHDGRTNIAAYYHQARAISIGGRSTYGSDDPTSQERFGLLAALAHEIGHVFLFDHLNAQELRFVGETYGGWGDVFKQDFTDNLLSEPFFRPHSLMNVGLQENNFASQYAFTNAHEWFADAFAAAILNRLGLGNHLGKDWRELLVKQVKRKTDYWADYNNVSQPFMDWLSKRAKF